MAPEEFEPEEEDEESELTGAIGDPLAANTKT
jgi:hypothetical protein